MNWLSADDVSTVAPIVHAAAVPDAAAVPSDAAANAAPKEVVARIFVAPTTDRDLVHRFGRVAIAAYLNVPVYAAFHDWMGRAELLTPMWEAWKAGDRAKALEVIPDEVVDDLIVWGTPEACRDHVARYVANGVTTPALAILPFGLDQRQAIRDLAPR